MNSPVDRRLAAKLHQQQIGNIRKADAIAAKVGQVYDRLLQRLLELAATADMARLRQGVHSAVNQAQADAYHVLESTYPELIRQAHAEASQAARGTIPPAWLRAAVHPTALREDADGGIVLHYELGPAADPTLLPAEYKRRVAEVVIPPLKQDEVKRILTSPGAGGLTWEERFRRYTQPDQDFIARELVDGVSSGEGIPALKKRMLPVVGGTRYRAQRIARTEARRVAEGAGRKAWDSMGELLDGMQILAVMDSHTRPEHAARNGKIYKKREDGSFRDEQGKILPELPDEPNCRCTAVPVLKMPKEFEADPRVAAEFESAQGDAIPDPAAYSDWFAGAEEADRVEAVGKRRYQVMADKLADHGRRPEWSDFLQADGSLAPIDTLKRETPEAAEQRKAEVRDMLAERERLYQLAGATGYVNRGGQLDANLEQQRRVAQQLERDHRQNVELEKGRQRKELERQRQEQRDREELEQVRRDRERRAEDRKREADRKNQEVWDRLRQENESRRRADDERRRVEEQQQKRREAEFQKKWDARLSQLDALQKIEDSRRDKLAQLKAAQAASEGGRALAEDYLAKRTPAELTEYLAEVKGNPGKAMLDNAKSAMSKLPHNVLIAVAQNGTRVNLAHEMRDAAPDIINRRPRNWPRGSTWANVDGCFRTNTNQVIACETYIGFWRGGKKLQSDRIDNVIAHETGHALDHYLQSRGLRHGESTHVHGGSMSKEFAEAYKADRAEIERYRKKDGSLSKRELKKQLAYFLPPEHDVGQSETFAEGLAVLQGHPARDIFAQHFPRSLEALRSVIANLKPRGV